MSTALHPVVLTSTAQEVLIRLVRLSLAENDADDAHLLHQLTELAASGLPVARASVWLRDEQLDAIVCQDLFDGSATHGKGTVLSRADFPDYFAALDRSVVIPAEDAHRHPATACFSKPYLTPLGIGAMLDAPIWRGGKAVGVLCLEHLGKTRTWSESDQNYAMQVALICGLYYEQHHRLAAERALRQREEQERTNQKMEALGRMACAIGHDFNNLLTSIHGQTEMLMRAGQTHAQVCERAGVVLEATARASALVKRLLNFGKGRDSTESEVDLGGVLRAMHKVLQSTVPKRIFLDLRVPDERLLIKGDVVSVEQVVMNLVVNARDAINDYGTITLLLQRGVDDEGQPSVVFKVADTGSGMDQVTLSRAFDPFYSTKGERGTGLGLSTCFTNMRRMGGRISITSSPGQGTTCICTFPSL